MNGILEGTSRERTEVEVGSLQLIVQACAASGITAGGSGK